MFMLDEISQWSEIPIFKLYHRKTHQDDFHIPRIWQSLKHFARSITEVSIHQA